MKTATNAAVLADALSLVMAPSPSSAVTAKWSPVQRKVAWDWCGREVLAANDNPVKRREPPEFLARWMIANNGPKPRRKTRADRTYERQEALMCGPGRFEEP